MSMLMSSGPHGEDGDVSSSSDDVVLIEEPALVQKIRKSFFETAQSNGSRSKASAASTKQKPKTRQPATKVAPKRKSASLQQESVAGSVNKPKGKRKSQIESSTNKSTSTLDKWLVKTPPGPSSSSTRPSKQQHQSSSSSKTQATVPAPKKKRFKSIHQSPRFMRVCRVCDRISSEHEISCAFQCAQCRMAVHQKCYDAKQDAESTKWYCRRCQFVLDQKEVEADSDNSHSDVTPADIFADVSSVEFPVHTPRSNQTSHKLHSLHGDSNFAVAFSFLHRFKSLGIKINAFSIEQLAEGFVEPTDNPLMTSLHLRLLSNLDFSVAKNHNWQHNLFRFLTKLRSDGGEVKSTSEWLPPAVTSRTLAIAGKDDSSASEVYENLSIGDRVVLFKFLCEKQFDENERLAQQIVDEELDDLREEPLGEDDHARNYWLLEDDGGFWLCRCSNADGSAWETVCDDIDGLELFLTELSLSQQSRDLLLWKAMRSTMLRRLKRKKQAETRRANAARQLESYDHDSNGSGSVQHPSGRVLRARKRVNYGTLEQIEDDFLSASSRSSRSRASKSSSEIDAHSVSTESCSEDDDDGNTSERDDDEDDEEEEVVEQPTRRSARQRRHVQYS